jgi:hypothetical protein
MGYAAFVGTLFAGSALPRRQRFFQKAPDCLGPGRKVRLAATNFVDRTQKLVPYSNVNSVKFSY